MNDEKQKLATPILEEGSKLLLIIRHAKSSWEVGTLNDFERPLNERGKKDAPLMAERLLDKKISIDKFVSSPAKRAKKTAELFCDAYNKNETSITFVSKLYQAVADTFYEAVEELDDAFTTVALFSHNPGITEFVNTLTETKIDNMPTCGIFAVKVATTKWKDFRKSKKELLFFDYPKLT